MVSVVLPIVYSRLRRVESRLLQWGMRGAVTGSWGGPPPTLLDSGGPKAVKCPAEAKEDFGGGRWTGMR